jgi:predicted DNA-binding transcriptional regulator AlpA
MKKTLHYQESECLALPAKAVAELLNISERHLWTLHASGRLPRPIRLGRATRWRADELRAWLAAGAPSRDCWEATPS